MYFGLDVEWEFSREPGAGGKHGKVSLLQLAINDMIYLIRLCKMANVPDSLKLLLSTEYPKAGVKILNDVNLLKDDYGIEVKNAVDVARLAFNKGIVSSTNSSLRTVCNKVLKYDLDKSENGPRESTWSQNKKLTED